MIAHLWQSTLFAGAAAVLTLLLRRNRARTRYWVWLAALVKFLVPFGILLSLGARIDLPGGRPQAPAMVAPAVSFVMGGDVNASSLRIVPAAPRDANPHWPEILFAIWACGFVAIAFCWMRRWMRVRAEVRRASPVAMGIGIPVVTSRASLEPGVFGIFCPVLVLPEGMEQHLNDSEWKCILDHELCHVRSHDNLTAAIYVLIETIFWFHPLVWWVGNKLVEERELACDEEVLRLGGDPRIYAEGILKVCELYLESPSECMAGVTGSDLKRRIRGIMAQRATETLTIGKKLLVAAAGVAAVAGPLMIGAISIPEIRAQFAPAGTPKFDLISIKSCPEPRQIPGVQYPARGHSSPGNLRTDCVPLLDHNGLGLMRAYAIDLFTPIDGAPSWVHSAFYDINAKADGNPSVATMRGPMMEALLEDRFKLKIHEEKIEGSVYFLTAARGGPKLKPFKEGSCTPYPTTRPVPPLPAGQQYCMTMIGLLPNKHMHVEATGVTLDEFAKLLRPVLGRPAINQTGISGKFDFYVEFSGEGTSLPGAAEASDPAGVPVVFTAIQEKLGLKLEAGKGPVNRLVIDHIERPAED